MIIFIYNISPDFLNNSIWHFINHKKFEIFHPNRTKDQYSNIDTLETFRKLFCVLVDQDSL